MDKAEEDNAVTFLYEDDNGTEKEISEINEVPDLDNLIGAKVMLPQNGVRMQSVKVIGRVTDDRDRPVGAYYLDSLLNSRLYEVLFPEYPAISCKLVS